MRFRISLYTMVALLCCTALFAQQTGSISGKVTADNQPLPGVTVEARSNVLPQPRVTTTDANGTYQLPQLVPGTYTLTFTLAGMQTATRRAKSCCRRPRTRTSAWASPACRRASPSPPRRRSSTRHRRRSRAACRRKRFRRCRSARTTAICRSSSPASCTPRTRSAVRAPARAVRTTSICSTASTSRCRCSAF